MTERAHLTIGEITGPGNCTMGNCTVDWDREHRCWRADLRPLLDEPPIQAWACTNTAAVLAVFAKWLGCVDELKGATFRSPRVGDTGVTAELADWNAAVPAERSAESGQGKR